MVDVSKWIIITFKFWGYWSGVKNQNRRKYEGGKERTIKFEKDLTNFSMLRVKLELICLWFIDYAFKLHYHVCATSLKEYKAIRSDTEVI